MLWLFWLCGCGEEAVSCGETYGLSEVSGAYVPYRWCNTIRDEVDAILGRYTCETPGVDSTFSLDITMPAPLATHLRATSIGYDDDLTEVISFEVRTDLIGPGGSAEITSSLDICNRSDNDVTRLFQVNHEDAERFFDGIVSGTHIEARSYTPVGVYEKVWEVTFAFPDTDVTATCE